LAPVHHAGTRRDFQTAQILRPELIGRFDEKIVFKLLCPDTQRQIARLAIAEVGSLACLK
jgi:ATP-dependent Clp protease ATP-binding subunit ClpA